MWEGGEKGMTTRVPLPPSFQANWAHSLPHFKQHLRSNTLSVRALTVAEIFILPGQCVRVAAHSIRCLPCESSPAQNHRKLASRQATVAMHRYGPRD